MLKDIKTPAFRKQMKGFNPFLRGRFICIFKLKCNELISTKSKNVSFLNRIEETNFIFVSCSTIWERKG